MSVFIFVSFNCFYKISILRTPKKSTTCTICYKFKIQSQTLEYIVDQDKVVFIKHVINRIRTSLTCS